MKKFILILSIFLVLFSCIGCTDKNEVTTVTPQKNVTYVKEYHDDSEDDFWTYMLWSNMLGSNSRDVHHYYHDTPTTHVTNTKVVNKYYNNKPASNVKSVSKSAKVSSSKYNTARYKSSSGSSFKSSGSSFKSSSKSSFGSSSRSSFGGSHHSHH